MQVLRMRLAGQDLPGDAVGEYYRKEDVDVEMQRLKNEVAEYRSRLYNARDFLMQVSPGGLTVEDMLEVLGFGRDGLNF